MFVFERFGLAVRCVYAVGLAVVLRPELKSHPMSQNEKPSPCACELDSVFLIVNHILQSSIGKALIS